MSCNRHRSAVQSGGPERTSGAPQINEHALKAHATGQATCQQSTEKKQNRVISFYAQVDITPRYIATWIRVVCWYINALNITFSSFKVMHQELVH